MTAYGLPLLHLAIWTIAFAGIGGVILKPWGWPEAVWATLGASVLVLSALLPWRAALEAIAKGTDVYLFLAGMMLLAELARREGLFDWLAVHAVKAANGSPARLFSLVYVVGIVVTTFLSNDATAVVLTPAVYAAAKAAKAEPLPYLVVCAFIANAASFVLPISNPANLVIYGEHMPPLYDWLRQFALPSLLAIAATYAVLRLYYRNRLRGAIATETNAPPLSKSGRYTAYGLTLTALVLLGASAFEMQLGAPTLAAAAATALFVLTRNREAPWRFLGGISWGILPLVAGLFVLVAGLQETGLVAALSDWLAASVARSEVATSWVGGAALAFATNLMNNLPAGLLAQSALEGVHAPGSLRGALLIGVDLGPNLSVTGSLATILWLAALRRDGVEMKPLDFLRIGALAMPPALILALGALIVTAR